MKVALVVAALIVQAFSTAPLAYSIVAGLFFDGLPWSPVLWGLSELPMTAAGIAAVVVAHRSLWLGKPRPAYVALIILLAVIAYAGWWFLTPVSWSPF